jgi:hypothetical protein
VASSLDIALDEALESVALPVGDDLQLDAVRLGASQQFHRADNDGLGDRAAPMAAGRRVVLGPEGDGGLVHLDVIWRTIFQTGTEAKLTIGRPEQVTRIRSTVTRTHEIRER